MQDEYKFNLKELKCGGQKLSLVTIKSFGVRGVTSNPFISSSNI